MIKILEVDFDDPGSLRKAFNLIKPRMVELEKRSILSKKEFNAIKYEACQTILNTDISHIYDKNLDVEKKYYVYAHCDPSDKLVVSKTNTNGLIAFSASIGLTCFPFYIGKGVGNRAYDLNRNDTHRKIRSVIKDRNKDISVQIIKNFLTESEALQLEAKLIDIYGLRVRGGALVNLDEGMHKDFRQNIYIESLELLRNSKNKYLS